MTAEIGKIERRVARAPGYRPAFWPSLNLLVDLLYLADVLAVPLAGLVSLAIFRDRVPEDALVAHAAACAVSLLLGIFVFSSVNAYKKYRKNRWDEGLLAAGAAVLLLFGVMIFGAFLLKVSEDYSRRWAVAWMALAFTAVAAQHLATRRWVRAKRAQGHFRSRVAVLGEGARAEHLVQQLARADDDATELVGVFAAGEGATGDLIRYAQRYRVDEVFVAMPWHDHERIQGTLDALRSLAVNVWLDLEGVERFTTWPSFRRVGETTLLRVERSPLSDRQLLLKSIEDLVLVSILLFALGPLMLLIAAAVKLTSPGPVLFRQKRYGFNNNVVEVFKFRTMYVDQTDADAARQTVRNDPRVTPLGRFLRRTSLDELPQLLNVLRGDMSVVGPRPHAVGMRTMQKLCHEIVSDYARRHRVKPGITGWAQINGYRGPVEDEEHLRKRIENDLYYIDNWSLPLDVKILFLTAVRCLFDKNAY